jgi:hypothetical protein
MELFQTLIEACEEIKRLHSEKKTDAVQTLASDIYGFAGQINDHMGSTAGCGLKTSEMLTEYRDMFTGNIEAANSKFFKALVAKARKIYQSADAEITADRMEVVFFPYNPSMVDCFETIWRAAKEDDSCDVYVVPIPYYELTPQGEPGQMHCERDKYPGYMNVINWEDYDVAARRPDAVFIHNPYDDQNLVTRVHPDFYASRLAEYTDMLVYIPYFAVIANVNEVFCVLPGTVFADKVFVESEKCRETYIRALGKWVREMGITRNHHILGKNCSLKEKIIALGSPKLEFGSLLRSGGYDIPAGWRGMLGEAEMSGKEVVLYNVRLTDMTDGIDNQLEKMKNSLKIFENQRDVLVLFRPHPLNIKCLQAMRPFFLAEYKRIIGGYIESGLGIYDDTAELHRAVALSGAYYGDWSSLVTMFDAAGKPVLVQDVNIKKREVKLDPVLFRDSYDDGGSLWASCVEYNALFRIDKGTLETEYMGSFPGEDLNKRFLYLNVCEANGKLYFAPFHASEIGVYDLASGEFSKIPFKGCYRTDKEYGGSLFIMPIPAGSGIFFIPFLYPSIIYYDFAENKLIFIDDWVEICARNEVSAYFSFGKVDGGKLILLFCHCNDILELDIEKKTSKIYPARPVEGVYKYANMIKIDNHWWFLRSNGDVDITEDFRAMTGWETIALPRVGNHKAHEYLQMVFVGGFVWLFPCESKEAFKICCKTKEVIKIDAVSEECNFNDLPFRISPYCFAREYGGGVIALGGRSGRFM